MIMTAVDKPCSLYASVIPAHALRKRSFKMIALINADKVTSFKTIIPSKAKCSVYAFISLPFSHSELLTSEYFDGFSKIKSQKVVA